VRHKKYENPEKNKEKPVYGDGMDLQSELSQKFSLEALELI